VFIPEEFEEGIHSERPIPCFVNGVYLAWDDDLALLVAAV